MAKYGLLNFLRIADAYINSDVSTIDGLERHLKSWFALKFNTTLDDPKLLDMTLEELVVLHEMHRIKADPSIVEETFNPEVKSYEEWLRQEMGDSYVSDEEMVEGMLQYDEASVQKRKENDNIKPDDLPDVITTDFSNLREWEDK